MPGRDRSTRWNDAETSQGRIGMPEPTSFATLQRWKQATKRVIAGNQRVARQRELIDQLRDQGCATQGAEAILRKLEMSQERHLADRAGIEHELAQIKDRRLLLDVTLLYLKELRNSLRAAETGRVEARSRADQRRKLMRS